MFIRLYVKKINRTFPVGEFADLPAASQEYLIQYGVDQSGTDSHAGVVHPDSKAKDGSPAKNAFKGTVAEYEAEVLKQVTDWVAKIQTGQVRAKTVEDPMVTTIRTLKSMSPEQRAAMLAELGLDGDIPEPKKGRKAA